uniref:Uncharacterized protein n=1 Tax=Arundo donax TaxID=35708 RepID=A0A0A8XZF7_ARUDO
MSFCGYAFYSYRRIRCIYCILFQCLNCSDTEMLLE